MKKYFIMAVVFMGLLLFTGCGENGVKETSSTSIIEDSVVVSTVSEDNQEDSETSNEEESETSNEAAYVSPEYLAELEYNTQENNF